MKDKSGKVGEYVGAVTDVTERKRAEAMLAGEKRLLEMIATGIPLGNILDVLCQIIEEQRKGTLASILLLHPDGVHLESVAGPSLPKGWTRQIASLPIGPCAGSCGTAAYRKSQVIVSDLATDPLWAVPKHRASALSYGLRASWSNPILSSKGKVLGTFCMYYRETRSPNSHDLELIELATHLARVAIERDVAEEALRQSESFLAEGQKISHTGTWSWNVSSGKIAWSEEHFRIFGFDPETIEPSFQLFLETVHPQDRSSIEQGLDEAVREKSGFDMEFRIALADGSIKNVQGVGRPVLTQSGDIDNYIGTTVDITARKRAEHELRRKEAYLSEAQKVSLTGSFGWNVSSGELIWSDETFRILGYDRATKPALDLVMKRVHPDDVARVQHTLDQAARDRTNLDFEHRLRLPDGTIKHVHVVAHPTTEESAEIEFVGAVMDVTAPKSSQQALESALHEAQILKDRFEMAIDTIPGLVWTALPDGNIDFLNRRWREYTGLKLDEASGWGWRVAIHPYDLPGLESYWRSVLASGEPGETEGRLRRFDGVYRWFLFRGVPLYDEAGKLVKWYGQTADIDDRKRAEEALRASEQVARGQAEALVQSLDILATAPPPEKFIGQMLRTIERLLKAQSVILWLLDEATDSVVLRACTDGANLDAIEKEHPFVTDPTSWKENEGLQEMLFTGVPQACEDIETDPRISSALRDYFRSDGTKKFLTIPTLVGGRVNGFIGIRHGDRPPYRPEEIELAQALAHQTMFAIQLNEFAEQARRAAVLEERNRMARDIHDTLAQGLTGVIVQLQAAEDATSKRYKKDARNHLRNAQALARYGLNEARRSVRALRPQALEDSTFWEALKGLIKSATVGTPLQTEFQLRGELRELPPMAQENLLHIGQEALTNTLKYAQATRFETRLSFNAREVRLDLQDNGIGFKVDNGHSGFGLTGMQERVDQMNGTLTIASDRGKGTKIVVVLPEKQAALV